MRTLSFGLMFEWRYAIIVLSGVKTRHSFAMQLLVRMKLGGVVWHQIS